MSRAPVITWILLLTMLSPGGEPVPAPADQRDFADSASGCAPATILNLLKFSGPEYGSAYDALVGADETVKMRFVVDRYFKNRPSETYPGRQRWGPHGIDSVDLVSGLNELLAENGLEKLKGTYLDQEESESEADHLLRCRTLIMDSIRRGVMPVLSLRSFVVRQREENADEPAWETGVHHYVLVTGVRDGESAFGFELDVIDPWRGRRTVIHVHREPHGQAFRALRGVEETGVWLHGRPFLQVLAHEVSTLRPKDLKWSERFIVVANFLAGRF